MPTEIKDLTDHTSDEADFVAVQDSGGAHGKTKIGSLLTRYVQLVLFDWTTAVETGDGKYYLHVPPAFDGMDLTYVHAEVVTAGSTGTLDIQVHNVDNALDMLSTKLTIDSGETGSDTADAAAVINASNDHINTNDVIRVDIDAVQSTAPQGLVVTLGFLLPMP